MSGDYDDDRDRDPYDREDDAESKELTPPRSNQMVRQSFEGISTMMNNSATQALVAKATADINARWMIAMHRPRHMPDVRALLLKECARPSFAVKAIYVIPRGKTRIKGLSIRFAEAALKAMGNMGCEAQTLYDSDEERVIRITVTDYEGNSAWARDVTVKKTKEVRQLRDDMRPIRTRINSYGDTVYVVEATDDDVTFKEASAISKASRTGILRLVPANILAEAQDKCEQTQQDQAAKDPDAERNKMLDAFASLNAKPSWVADWLGKPVEQVVPAEIVELQQVYRAIRDGETNLDEALKARRAGRESKTQPLRTMDRPPGSGAVSATSGQKGRRQQPTPPHGNGEPPPVSPDEAKELERLEAERAKLEK
jgi:hypothetical protein